MRSGKPARLLGVVLAGGTSRRLGRDKATLRIGGSTLVEHAARRLVAVCERVVVADRGRRIAPPLVSVADAHGLGPASGILGAAAAVPDHELLVLACDLPAVPVALLARLAESAGDWVVPRWQRGVEPLCALYRADAIAALAARVATGRMALHRLQEQGNLSIVYLQGTELSAFGAPERMFLNINTPDDLAASQVDLP